ncbi:LamG domain-containing protein [Streptomyces spinosus]|uniref:LamG domain-containing protein n=1 Tax=Streptomyces spinosus TaxID=2872623 RepID=UPI001CEC5622|nr:LamG domain-containing protein [Streptomyces spinosus]
MSQRSDAASDRVSYTASPPPDPASAFTVTLWARLRVDRDDFSTMVRLHSASGGSTTVNVAGGSNGTTPVVVSPGNTSGIVGTDSLAVDTWRMIAVTVSGTGATGGKIYTRSIGGTTNIVTGQVSGGSTPDGITLFGRSPGDAGEWFNGGLAYVRVWSAVLSQAEIEAEWASPTIVRTSGVWANWPLLTNINDVSGNGRNLTAGTTALTTEDDPPLTTTVTGSATAALGGLTAAASGTPTVRATAAGQMGGLTATASGTRKVTGTAGASLGALTGTAIARRTVISSATAQLGGLTGTASAPSHVAGSGAGALGGLTGTAHGRVPGAPEQGSWYGLIDILREGAQLAREERERDPVACLDCGEPLRSGPRGERYCPFDGSIWGAGGRRIGHVSTARV